MRTKLIFIFIACLFCSVTFAGKSTIVINAGSVAPEGTPWAALLDAIKKRMEGEAKEAGINIKVKTYLGGKLGGEREMIEETKRGNLQLVGVSAGALAAQYVPELNVFELPFLFDTNEEVDFVMNKMRKQISDLLMTRGFVLAQWSENGWHGFATKKKCILKPSDLIGLRMRAQESTIHLNTYKSFGATPVELPVPEVLSALEVGVVDGFSTTPLFSFATGWYRPISYYSYTRHIYQPGMIVLSKKWFDKLDKKLQKILTDPKEETEGLQQVRALNEPLLDNFKAAGVKVCRIDDKKRKVFEKKSKIVWEKFANKSPASKKMLEAVLAAKKEFRNKKAAKG